MKITSIQDLIRILPLDPGVKTELLDSWDHFSADQKYDIEGVLWDTYDAMFDLKIKEHAELMMLKAKDNQEKLDNTFYKRAEEAAQKDMDALSDQTATQADLVAARKAMEMIVGEIRASKSAKKPKH